MNLDEARDLISAGQLLSNEKFEDYRTSWLEGDRTEEEGADFILWLVDLRELTEFQGLAVLAGIPGPYLLGPYRVNARITAGLLGDLFQAEQVEFRQPVSLKIFPMSVKLDPERLARMGREARVSIQIDSPYVAKTYQIGRVGPIHFMALESLNGETLEQKLEREGTIGYSEACQLIQQAALGLADLHALEIIHRDICPANLWVSNHGNVKILEFGAARDALSFVDSTEESGAELTMTQSSGRVLGTYAYMSAAQAENPHAANELTDLYSLGCVFYHCLTGQTPFPDQNPVRQMLRHASEEPRPLSEFDPEIPDAVQEVVSKLLAKRPEERYASANEAAVALAGIAPLVERPEPIVPTAEFLEWTHAVDGLHGTVFEEPQDPEWCKFAQWLSEDHEPQGE